MKFPWLMNSPLFDVADEGAGGGGGGTADGAGGGAGSGSGSGGADDQSIANLKLSDLTKLITDAVTSGNNALDAKFDARFKKLTDKGQQTQTQKKDDKQSQQKTDQNQNDSPELADLRQRLADSEAREKERTDAADKKEAKAELKLALAPFEWDDQSNSDTAFDYFEGKIERDDEGNLVINGKPLVVAIKEIVPKRFAGFLKKRDVGGSGATKGGASKNQGPQIEDIKVGASKETLAAASAHIASLWNQTQAR